MIVNGDEIKNKTENDFELIINQLLNFLYLEVINNSNINYNQKSIYLNGFLFENNNLDFFFSESSCFNELKNNL